MNDTDWPNLLLRMLLEFPYQPSPLPVIDAALDLARLGPDDVFADLGCGDGVVLIRAAGRFGVFSVGFEIDRRLVDIALKKSKAAGLSNLIEIVNLDLFTADISRFTVIYIYPYPPIVGRLSEKIFSECSKRSRLIVHDYPLEHLNPIRVVHIPGGNFHTHKIYLYEI
jgi:SAM-dependent methyltransferase